MIDLLNKGHGWRVSKLWTIYEDIHTVGCKLHKIRSYAIWFQARMHVFNRSSIAGSGDADISSLEDLATEMVCGHLCPKHLFRPKFVPKWFLGVGSWFNQEDIMCCYVNLFDVNGRKLCTFLPDLDLVLQGCLLYMKSYILQSRNPIVYWPVHKGHQRGGSNLVGIICYLRSIRCESRQGIETVHAAHQWFKNEDCVVNQRSLWPIVIALCRPRPRGGSRMVRFNRGGGGGLISFK